MKKLLRNNLNKYINYLKKDGFLEANKKTIIYILHAFKILQAVKIILNKIGIRSTFDAVSVGRNEVSMILNKFFNSTINYGPFKGMKLSNSSWWSLGDRGSMILGIYEKEVLDTLNNISKKYTTLINLGAGDGYYGVGVLVNNLFKKSICYELSDKGRKAIRENAQLNNVLHKIEIKGGVKNNFYNEIPSIILSNSVLLIDIEGAEFNLVNKETFKAFSRSVIIIEIHDFFFEDGQEKIQKIRNESSSTHIITELRMGARDLSIFPELRKFHDNDRWLICSDSRAELMTWLKFDPK